MQKMLFLNSKPNRVVYMQMPKRNIQLTLHMLNMNNLRNFLHTFMIVTLNTYIWYTLIT